MVVLAGEVLLEAALHTNGIDAEFETVIHVPSAMWNATYQREPDGSPKSFYQDIYSLKKHSFAIGS